MSNDFEVHPIGTAARLAAVRTTDRDPHYTSLRTVLDEAYAQAATGKGRERHAGGQPFEDQPMQVISDMLGSNDGMAFQAIKKIREGLAMPESDRTVRELLGAIVYIAGIVVRVRRGEVRVQDDQRDWCTDPDNCRRCKAPAWDQKNHSHAGISIGAQRNVNVVPDPRAIPAVEKRCVTCKYVDASSANAPCKSCKGYSHWTPIVVRASNVCSLCKYDNVAPGAYPCNTCVSSGGARPTKWEEKS